MSLPIEICSMVSPFLDGLVRDVTWELFIVFNLERHQLTSICSGVQVSRSTDLTLLICVPMLRCTPEHLMQMKQPLHTFISEFFFGFKVLGERYRHIPWCPASIYVFHHEFLERIERTLCIPFFLQSAHILFTGSFTNSRSTRACLSVVALSCLYIVFVEYFS